MKRLKEIKIKTKNFVFYFNFYYYLWDWALPLHISIDTYHRDYFDIYLHILSIITIC